MTILTSAQIYSRVERGWAMICAGIIMLVIQS